MDTSHGSSNACTQVMHGTANLNCHAHLRFMVRALEKWMIVDASVSDWLFIDPLMSVGATIWNTLELGTRNLNVTTCRVAR